MYHSALDHTPFEVIYGHEPRHLLIVADKASVVPGIDTTLQERCDISYYDNNSFKRNNG